MSGYVKLWRAVQDDPLWTEKPFSKGQAWVDMILLANWKDSHFFSRGIRVDVRRGQMAWSVVSLAERWGWSRNKVLRFLDYLEAEHQIEQQANNVTTLISLKNYEKYQENGTSDGTPNETPNGTSDGTHPKKGKKEKKTTGGKFTPPGVGEVRDYCESRQNGIDPQAFVDHYQSNGWMVGKNKMKDWKAAVRTWEARRKNEPRPEKYGADGI